MIALTPVATVLTHALIVKSLCPTFPQLVLFAAIYVLFVPPNIAAFSPRLVVQADNCDADGYMVALLLFPLGVIDGKVFVHSLLFSGQ